MQAYLGLEDEVGYQWRSRLASLHTQVLWSQVHGRLRWQIGVGPYSRYCFDRQREYVHVSHSDSRLYLDSYYSPLCLIISIASSPTVSVMASVNGVLVVNHETSFLSGHHGVYLL